MEEMEEMEVESRERGAGPSRQEEEAATGLQRMLRGRRGRVAAGRQAKQAAAGRESLRNQRLGEMTLQRAAR